MKQFYVSLDASGALISNIVFMNVLVRLRKRNNFSWENMKLIG